MLFPRCSLYTLLFTQRYTICSTLRCSLDAMRHTAVLKMHIHHTISRPDFPMHSTFISACNDLLHSAILNGHSPPNITQIVTPSLETSLTSLTSGIQNFIKSDAMDVCNGSCSPTFSTRYRSFRIIFTTLYSPRNLFASFSS